MCLRPVGRHQRIGKLDVLVNNAGIGSPRGPDGARVLIETLTEDQWDRTLDVNAKGVFLGTRAAIPEMRKAGGGSIINISSVAGLVGGTTSAYGASKGAVVCSPRRPPFSTPGKAYAPTPCIPVSSSPPWPSPCWPTKKDGR